MKIKTLKHLAVIELKKYDPEHILEVARSNREATVLKDEDGNETFRVNVVDGNYYNAAHDIVHGVTIATRKDGTDITIAFNLPVSKEKMAKVIAPILPKLDAVLTKFGEAIVKYDAAVNATLEMFEDTAEITADAVPTTNEEA